MTKSPKSVKRQNRKRFNKYRDSHKQPRYDAQGNVHESCYLVSLIRLATGKLSKRVDEQAERMKPKESK